MDRRGGPAPLPVTYSLTTDERESCRGVMRIINHDPERTKKKVDVGTREVRLNPGDVYYLLYDFERPAPGAKELRLDIAGEDVGHAGRIRFRIPAGQTVRE